MRHDNRFKEVDKAALHRALLNLGVCPNCRNDLQPVALFDEVEGCSDCRETWYMPDRRVS